MSWEKVMYVQSNEKKKGFTHEQTLLPWLLIKGEGHLMLSIKCSLINSCFPFTSHIKMALVCFFFSFFASSNHHTSSSPLCTLYIPRWASLSPHHSRSTTCIPWRRFLVEELVSIIYQRGPQGNWTLLRTSLPMLEIGKRVFSGSNRVEGQLGALAKLVGDSLYLYESCSLTIWLELILVFLLCSCWNPSWSYLRAEAKGSCCQQAYTRGTRLLFVSYRGKPYWLWSFACVFRWVPPLVNWEWAYMLLAYICSYWLFLDFFADMNSLNWASPSGRKSKASWGAGISAAGEVARSKRGHEEQPSSPMVGASSGSSGQRREQLPPRPARTSLTGKSVLSSSESSNSMVRYLEAFKTSLGDISQGEWNTLEGLADEDSMGAATRATMMVRHLFAHYACIFSSSLV